MTVGGVPTTPRAADARQAITRAPWCSRRYARHLERFNRLGFAYGIEGDRYRVDQVRSDAEYWAFMAGYQWGREVAAAGALLAETKRP